jgi:hypothetical protein
MIFLCLVFHPLLSFATFSLVYPFFYIPEDSNLMQFSLLLLWLCVMCVQSNSITCFNLPYSRSVHTFQNPILVFRFMPKGSPLASGRLLFISVSLISVFKVCRLLAYSTRSQWWGCHLSLWAGWFSVGVSSLSLWRSRFATRQWCWFWSAPGILFPQCPPYLVSVPLSTSWGGARWETSFLFSKH